jgi:hypothetical protein
MNTRLPCIVHLVDASMVYKSNGEIGPTPLSRHCGQVERPTSNLECERMKKQRKAGKKEVGKLRRWEKSKTEAFDCGLWNAGKKEVGKLGR